MFIYTTAWRVGHVPDTYTSTSVRSLAAQVSRKHGTALVHDFPVIVSALVWIKREVQVKALKTQQ